MLRNRRPVCLPALIKKEIDRGVLDKPIYIKGEGKVNMLLSIHTTLALLALGSHGREDSPTTFHIPLVNPALQGPRTPPGLLRAMKVHSTFHVG